MTNDQRIAEALNAMMDVALGKDIKEARHSEPIRKSLCDDFFTLAANVFILGPANEAEECMIAEIQAMIKRLSTLMGYSSVGAFLAGLRERAK